MGVDRKLASKLDLKLPADMFLFIALRSILLFYFLFLILTCWKENHLFEQNSTEVHYQL